jgi:hypothetical protein
MAKAGHAGAGRQPVNNLSAVQIIPITFGAAIAFIQAHHRHHRPPVGCKFCLAVADRGVVVGVLTAGRPVARLLDDGRTIEVTRCCTDGTRNACSMLYGAARRIARDMGYRRIITYTLTAEAGASLKASGWRRAAETRGGSWDRPARRRADRHPVAAKVRWECMFF